jgi:hypothetical protein
MVFSLGLVLTGVAMPAAAAPGTTEDTVDVNLSLTGSAGTTTGSIPVLPGLTPVALSTTITGGTGPAAAAAPTLSVRTASQSTPHRRRRISHFRPAPAGTDPSRFRYRPASTPQAARTTPTPSRVSLVTVSYRTPPRRRRWDFFLL